MADSFTVGDHTFNIEDNGDGSGKSLKVNGGRFLEFRLASSGTMVELRKPGDLPDGTPLTLDAARRAVFVDA